MRRVPPAVITLWIPALCSAGLFLFLNGLEPQYWVICIAGLPLLGFMNTLAEVRRHGKQIRIRRWWGSISVDESDIVDISRSVLQGIGRLRVRRCVPPWGVVYFVADWSNVEVLHDSVTVRQADPPVNFRSRAADLFAAVLLAASGFVLGRMLIGDFHKFSIARASSSIRR